MSVISGDAVALIQDMEDKEVMEEYMKVLRGLFKEQVIFVKNPAAFHWCWQIAVFKEMFGPDLTNIVC